MLNIDEIKNTIICGDCLEVMKQLPDKCVDLVLTDPPYGTTDGKGKVIRRGNDDVEFGEDWDKELPLDWISEIVNIIKEDRWGLIFTDKKAVSDVWNKLGNCGLRPRNTFYWHKTNKAPTPRSNFKSCVETAVVFTRGRTNQKWRGGATTDNIFHSPFCREGLHPTQKPIELFEHLIKLFTDVGDTVLDPFLGSGTTAVACYRTRRNYIGIEISPEYCKIAEKRIQEEKNKLARCLMDWRHHD